MSILSKISEFMAKYREFNKTFYELSGLSDSQLKDMGIYRGDIPRIAMGNSERAAS